MECDNIHARIAKKNKLLEIFTPAQWYGNMTTAKLKKPQYVVKEVTQKDIISFKKRAPEFMWEKVPISQIRKITFDSFSRGTDTFRKHLDSPVTKCDILKLQPGTPINWATHKLKCAYNGRLPLNPKHVTDWKWFIKGA